MRSQGTSVQDTVVLFAQAVCSKTVPAVWFVLRHRRQLENVSDGFLLLLDSISHLLLGALHTNNSHEYSWYMRMGTSRCAG